MKPCDMYPGFRKVFTGSGGIITGHQRVGMIAADPALTREYISIAMVSPRPRMPCLARHLTRHPDIPADQ
jgi:putative lipase involved disintegration of autophagic bodies